MPNVTTYIRNEDMALWKACPNKAELIHNALRKTPHRVNLTPEAVIVPYAGDLTAKCKIHGIPLDNHGKCLQKGCKYA